MTPYILIFLFASFLFFNPSDRKAGIAYYFFIILLILFSGFRDMIGGYDVYIYAEVYEMPKDKLLYFNTFEIGFRWFYYILRFFSDNRFFMFFISAAIIMITHFAVVKKHSPILYFSVFILFCKFFLMSFVYLRQGIAMGVIWLSISYILKKDFFKFLGLVLFAFLLHKSAIIFLPIYFIANKQFNPMIMFVIAVVALFVSVTPFSQNFMYLISEYLDNDRIDAYISKSEGINIFYLLESVLLILLLLKFREKFYETQKSTLIFNGLFIYVLLNIMTLTNASFVRLGWYYFIFLVLALPLIYSYLSSDQLKKVFKMTIYLYYSMLFFRLLIVYDDGDFMPYKTIFQDFDRNSQWEFMDKR